jgi:hypothetical protein
MQHRMLGGGYTDVEREYDQGYAMEQVRFSGWCTQLGGRRSARVRVSGFRFCGDGAREKKEGCNVFCVFVGGASSPCPGVWVERA